MNKVDNDLSGFVHEHVWDKDGTHCGRDPKRVVRATLSHRHNEIEFFASQFNSPEGMFRAIDGAKYLIHAMYEIGKKHRSREILHMLGGKEK